MPRPQHPSGTAVTVRCFHHALGPGPPQPPRPLGAREKVAAACCPGDGGGGQEVLGGGDQLPLRPQEAAVAVPLHARKTLLVSVSFLCVHKKLRWLSPCMPARHFSCPYLSSASTRSCGGYPLACPQDTSRVRIFPLRPQEAGWLAARARLRVSARRGRALALRRRARRARRRPNLRHRRCQL